MLRISRVIAAALGVLAVYGLAIGPTAAQTPRKVTVVMDWIPSQPQHFAYQLAKAKGYYAENGLDVTVQGSRGSNLVLQLVVAGQAEFGNISAPALVQAVAKQNAPAKMVGTYFQKDTTAVAWFQSSGIKSVKDFEGKTIGIVPGTLQFVLWPSFAKAAGFDASKVRLINSDFQLIWSQWATKRFDAIGNFLLGGTDAERFEKEGETVKAVGLSDFLPLVGHGIVASNALIEKEPATVKGFVKATQKAWAYMAQQPQEAAREASQVIAKNVENAAPAASIERYSLSVIPTRMMSPSTRGKPIGWSNPSDWEKMVDVLAETGDYPKKPSVSDLMTNRFIEE